MKELLLSVATIGLLASCQPSEKAGFSGKLETQADSVSYALGLNMVSNLKQSNFEDINTEAMAAAMNSAQQGDSAGLMTVEEANQVLQSYADVRRQAQAEKKYEAYIQENEAFLEQNSTREGVTVLPSGLQYEILEPAEGPKPLVSDVIVAHYKGMLVDSTVFDSSYDRGEPLEMPLANLIPGWKEGITMMSVGSKWRFIIPQELGYGNREMGGPIKPYSTLIFEVELLDIKSAE